MTQLFLFPKYRKNFVKIACFKSFLRISERMPISSEFWNAYKFPQLFRIPFSSNYSQCQEKFYPIFLRNVCPKICLQFAFKNFKHILPQIVSLCSTTPSPLCCSFLAPVIPSATIIIQVRVSGEQGDQKIRWTRSKYNLQQLLHGWSNL